MRKTKLLQLSLLSIGFALIFAVYFLYPKINEKKISKDLTEKKEAIETTEASNVFEEVEYKGIFGLNNQFTIKSEKARVSDENDDIVFMENVITIINMKDGRIIKITSDKGKYSKSTYDCWFESNVNIFDEDTEMTSDNLDLLSSKNLVVIYNNVILINKDGSLRADKIDYNFDTKRYLISMFNDNKIDIKLTQ
tara:strand:- start:576 stop:1157 length:582 start_codon:yes stop_codon:yes gene_type:complete